MNEAAIDTSAQLRDELAQSAPAPVVVPDSLPQPDPRQCVLLVDLGALYAHAWHATNRDVEPDEPAEAALRRVRAWGQMYPHIAICCDDPSGNWRRAEFSGYKATRSEKPDGYGAQLRRAIEILRRDGYPIWFCGDLEADDVMACGARCVLERTALTAIIATADKDLCQLVGDRVIVLNTRTSNYWGPEQVRAKFGVAPEQIRELLTLMGDASDNVPGVPGIGGKTAAELLAKHGSLAAIVTAAENGRLKPKQNENIVANAETIALAYRLVGLKSDVDMPVDEVLRKRGAGPLSPPLPEPEKRTLADEEAPDSAPPIPPADPIEPTRIQETKMANVAPIHPPTAPANQNGASHTAPVQSQPAAPARFAIVRGSPKQPHAFILTGRPGIGKTYLASTLPGVAFICVESGLKGASNDHIDQVARFDHQPRTFDQFIEDLAQMRALAKSEGLRHLVIDSMTGVERLVNAHTCKQENVAHMEAKDFKKVWTAAIPHWQRVQNELDRCRGVGLHVWVITHSAEAKESVAESGETYAKADLAFQGAGDSLTQLRNFWRAWADHVLFIDWDSMATKSTLGKKSVGQYRARVLRTRETPFCFAKSRGGLPEKLPATWRDLEAALRAGVSAPDAKMRKQIEALLPQLDEEQRKSVEEDVASAKTPTALAAALSRAQGFISASRDENEEERTAQPSAASVNEEEVSNG